MRPTDIVYLVIILLIFFTGTAGLIIISTGGILVRLNEMSHECIISPNPNTLPNHESD
jgi:uncharacterized membrane protein YqiK